MLGTFISIDEELHCVVSAPPCIALFLLSPDQCRCRHRRRRPRAPGRTPNGRCPATPTTPALLKGRDNKVF